MNLKITCHYRYVVAKLRKTYFLRHLIWPDKGKEKKKENPKFLAARIRISNPSPMGASGWMIIVIYSRQVRSRRDWAESDECCVIRSACIVNAVVRRRSALTLQRC